MKKLFFFILSLTVFATVFSCKIKKTPTEIITQKDFRIGFIMSKICLIQLILMEKQMKNLLLSLRKNGIRKGILKS